MRSAQTPARSSRLAGAAGALLLQGGFLFLFLASMPVFRPPVPLERELAIIMPRLRPVPAPPAPAGPGKEAVPVTPPLPTAPAPPFTAPLPPASALPGLQGFGQALNNCAPEKYNNLTPQQRANCSRPGEGMPLEQGLNLSVPHEAKDEATWQEIWDEKHWMPGLCGPDSPERGADTAAFCMMNQSIAEAERAADVNWHLARAHAASLKPPPPPVPPAASAPETIHPPG